MDAEGKLEISDIQFENLKQIKYAYRPEMVELQFNTQLKKQLQAFNKQKSKGPSIKIIEMLNFKQNNSKANLCLPAIKSDYKIFQVEKCDPKSIKLNMEKTKQQSSLQKDGKVDELTFNLYDYVVASYEQNVQNRSLDQVPEDDGNQGSNLM